MAITPTGHRILVKQEDYDETDDVFKSARKAGIEIVKDRGTRYQESVDKGVILAIGPTAWKDFGGVNWANVGDTIVFAKHAGKRVEDPADKETHYVVLNDEDVVAVITE
jgi:co-chaperonin GroES (HSP10)